MLMVLLNVVYVLIAVAMVALILMQRGAGAQAGSGFGAGASATVFGSRGSSNFLSKATKWLAIAFFGISLFMAWNASRPKAEATPTATDLGVMSQVPTAPANGAVPAVPAPATTQAPADAVPAVPAPVEPAPVPAQQAPAATPAAPQQ